MLGFSASQPWDRSEETWNIATTVTKLVRNHTVKLGGEWRNNRDMLLQTQDAGGPRGNFRFDSDGTGLPSEAATLNSVANSMASFLLDWPGAVQRDLKVIDEPGTQHSAVFTLRAGQVAGSAEHHDRPRSALGILHATDRSRRRRQPLELRPGDEHTARRGLRHGERIGRRQKHVQQPQRADRHLLAAERRHGAARRIRWEHDSVSGQPLCLQLPRQAELLGHGAQRLPGRWLNGHGLPGAYTGQHPAGRRHSRLGLAPELDLRRHPAGPA